MNIEKQRWSIRNVMKNKPIEKNKADVIFTTSYVTVDSLKVSSNNFKGLVDYSERENATDLNNDFNVLLEKEADDHEVKFEKFVDYTSRNTATIIEQLDSEATATFTESKDNITQQETKILKEKLDIAQKNKAVLWPSVLSFSTSFLIENNLFDPDSGHFDQKKTKAAIRNNMHTLIENNHLDSSAFWWGDIQFDTNHVHVHINLSEETPHRDKVKFERHGELVEEFKGNLKQQSLKSFKSHVTMDLIALGNPKMKNYRLNYEKKVAILRSSLKDDLKVNIKKTDLDKLMLRLPENQNLWRYKSNAKTMVEPKLVINKIINNYLNENSDYKQFTQTLSKLDSYNSKKFGRRTQGKTFKDKDSELKERLGNALLKMCKELPKEEKRMSVDGLANNYSPDDIDANLDTIQFLKKKLRDNEDFKNPGIKKEIMIRKIGLKRQKANLELERLAVSHDILQSIKKKKLVGNEKSIIGFLEQRFQNEREFSQLKLKNSWDLTEEEHEKLNYLQGYFSDEVNIPVNKVSSEVRKAINNRLGDENVQLITLKNIDPDLKELLMKELGFDKNIKLKSLKKQTVLRQQLIDQKFNLQSLKKDPNYSKEEAARRYKKIKELNDQLTLSNLTSTEKIKVNFGQVKEKFNQLKVKNPRKFKQQFEKRGSSLIRTATHDLKQQLSVAKQTKQKEKSAQNAMFQEEREVEYSREAER